MKLQPNEVLFVGDAWSDYEAAKAADISFVYFLPDLKNPDPEIPPDVPQIKTHSEIFKHLES